MIQKYTFFDGGTIEFEDSRSVKDLISYAFDIFDYYEPLGMEFVTIFQGHHPATDTGWFTTDVNRSCAEEIRYPEDLFFAYHMPGVFYFAEGGWGHHMCALGNHPEIEDPVSLHIRFEDFNHTVVVNGSYRVCDILDMLKRSEYIPEECIFIKVIPVGCADKSYLLSIEDPAISLPLSEFENVIKEYNQQNIPLSSQEAIYHMVYEFCCA